MFDRVKDRQVQSSHHQPDFTASSITEDRLSPLLCLLVSDVFTCLFISVSWFFLSLHTSVISLSWPFVSSTFAAAEHCLLCDAADCSAPRPGPISIDYRLSVSTDYLLPCTYSVCDVCPPQQQAQPQMAESCGTSSTYEIWWPYYCIFTCKYLSWKICNSKSWSFIYLFLSHVRLRIGDLPPSRLYRLSCRALRSLGLRPLIWALTSTSILPPLLTENTNTKRTIQEPFFSI